MIYVTPFVYGTKASLDPGLRRLLRNVDIALDKERKRIFKNLKHENQKEHLTMCML
jgi:hypothetical protein|tara:strand:- start:394 stop:561 length:168 start_codon:yes stop_codon:yes gene_type:complete